MGIVSSVFAGGCEIHSGKSESQRVHGRDGDAHGCWAWNRTEPCRGTTLAQPGPFAPRDVLTPETIAMRLCWGLVLASIASAAAQNPETKSPAAASTGFRFEAIGDKSLGLWEGDRPVFVYHFGAVTSSNAPNARSRSNYFHPLYGLDGEVLTDDFPHDHDYHRGLYWAWSHIQVGDQEVDSWSLRGIRYEFQRWLAKEARSDGVRLGVENGWFVGDKQIMRETIWLQVQPRSAAS